MAVTTACILVAAGRGERLGAGPPKALRLLAGEALVVHAARSALDSGVVDLVVVAAPAELLDQVRSAMRPLQERSVIVAGGATRRESVSVALTALPGEIDVVLVHDAARCLTPPEMFVAVASAVSAGSVAVVPVLPVTDTVKEVDGEVVLRTLDRSTLRVTQTPQGFRREILVRAHGVVDSAVTDDAGLVERLGAAVHVVPGHAEAFKVTRPLDLALAEAVLAQRSAQRSGGAV